MEADAHLAVLRERAEDLAPGVATLPSAFIMLCGLQLVPLHQVDGRVILVNPNEITAVATPRRGDQRLGSPATACMVFMSDGTHWQVLETCAAVKQLIEK